MIRNVTKDDIDWIYESGKDYYIDLNEQDTKEELNKMLNRENSIFIRSDTAVFAAIIGSFPYNRKKIVMEDRLFFGRNVIELIKVAIGWAKANGATDFDFSLGPVSKAKTIKPLAKRLGATTQKLEFYNLKLV